MGVVPIGTLPLYEVFMDGSQPASALEQLWSRVGISELLPGLTEFEARLMIQKALGRVPELTIKQIVKQTGNSIRRLTNLLEHLRGLQELNEGTEIGELITAAQVIP